VCVEHKKLYATEGPVPEEDEETPIGQALVRREGSDVTLVAYSNGVLQALAAAEELAQLGIDCEVVDLRTLVPMDTECVLASVRKTGRLVTVEEGTRTGGVGAEVAARVAEEAYEYLDAPVRRVAAADLPIPFSRPLEELALPGERDVVDAVVEIFGRG
jgi:pyruvate dehydrogenase E1 component beta subunit